MGKNTKPVKAPAKKKPARKSGDSATKKYLADIYKLVHAPNTSKGIVDEVVAYCADKPANNKPLNFIRTICHQSETNTEKVQMLIAYLQSV